MRADCAGRHRRKRAKSEVLQVTSRSAWDCVSKTACKQGRVSAVQLPSSPAAQQSDKPDDFQRLLRILPLFFSGADSWRTAKALRSNMTSVLLYAAGPPSPPSRSKLDCPACHIAGRRQPRNCTLTCGRRPKEYILYYRHGTRPSCHGICYYAHAEMHLIPHFMQEYYGGQSSQLAAPFSA